MIIRIDDGRGRWRSGSSWSYGMYATEFRCRSGAGRLVGNGSLFCVEEGYLAHGGRICNVLHGFNSINLLQFSRHIRLTVLISLMFLLQGYFVRLRNK
jgi:hypothetical protein